MAQFLYWLDRGGFVALFQHGWTWAALIAGAANVLGIAAILRRDDASRRS